MAEASSQFVSYFKTSSKDGFSTHAKVNEYIIDDLVRGSLRVNYGQSLNVHLFVGRFLSVQTTLLIVEFSQFRSLKENFLSVFVL
jgi:hypothetical protein